MAEDLKRQELNEIEVAEDGSFNLHGNNDLFLCKCCKKPMTIGRSRG